MSQVVLLLGSDSIKSSVTLSMLVGNFFFDKVNVFKGLDKLDLLLVTESLTQL